MLIRLLALLLLLLIPTAQSYLLGCYYDYGQPLVIAEQLPSGTCTHVLLIGATIVKNLSIAFVDHPYDGSTALQAMRDYRARDSNKLKVLPSLLGDDAEWQAAMANEASRQIFIGSLVQFAARQVDRQTVARSSRSSCSSLANRWARFRLGISLWRRQGALHEVHRRTSSRRSKVLRRNLSAQHGSRRRKVHHRSLL